MTSVRFILCIVLNPDLSAFIVSNFNDLIIFIVIANVNVYTSLISRFSTLVTRWQRAVNVFTDKMESKEKERKVKEVAKYLFFNVPKKKAVVKGNKVEYFSGNL